MDTATILHIRKESLTMKINYITLENFSSIDTAMHAKRIHIDFTKATNKIILLVGSNGSGKTSLLSLLTPFATIGSLDVRNSSNLILLGKDGYKEIEIQNGKHKYLIKHFYTHKKEETHSVKSYIMKDGKELNPNGNVTSFKEYVKDELHVELDYLKLIRLGSNVTSMIDLSETERKKFMNKLLEEADVFAIYFKKVNETLKQLKVMISHTIDKQAKLPMVSIEESEDDLEKLDKVRKEKEAFCSEVTGQLSIAMHNVNLIEDPVSLKIEVHDLEKRLEKMERILEKGDFESHDPSFYEKKIQKITIENTKRDSQKDANVLMQEQYLSFLDEVYVQKSSLAAQMQTELQKEMEEKALEDSYFSLGKEIADLKKNLPQKPPRISLAQVSDLIVFLKNTQLATNRTYEFGKAPVNKALDLLKSSKNIHTYIEKQMNANRSTQDADILLNRLKTTYRFRKEDLPSSCMDDTCMARRAYLAIGEILYGESVKKNEETPEFLQSVEYVYQNLQHILNGFIPYMEVISLLPDELRDSLTMNKIYENLSKLENLYNDMAFQSLYTELQEYQHLEELKAKQAEVERVRDMVKGTSNTSRLEEQIHQLDSSIEEKQNAIKDLKAINHRLDDEMKEASMELEYLRDVYDTLSSYDTIKKSYEEKSTKYQSYVENSKDVRELTDLSARAKKELTEVEDQMNNIRITISAYKSIQKDLKKYNKIYDEMVLVKESLSSSKGIPIRFIKNYLGNTEEITNELLDIAFNGKIFIDKFKITQDEFTIPFYNDGKLLPDVKLASQGETSFISIALAFALSSQTMHEYNIMLLDEIDATLDVQFREKFLKILENQIDRINAEQCFLITHGNMFSSYPVDVIHFGNDSLYEGTIEIEKE